MGCTLSRDKRRYWKQKDLYLLSTQFETGSTTSCTDHELEEDETDTNEKIDEQNNDSAPPATPLRTGRYTQRKKLNSHFRSILLYVITSLLFFQAINSAFLLKEKATSINISIYRLLFFRFLYQSRPRLRKVKLLPAYVQIQSPFRKC